MKAEEKKESKDKKKSVNPDEKFKNKQINYNELVRFLALDKCFGNPAHEFIFTDLLEECCIAMDENIPGMSEGESKLSDRQLKNDLEFMRSKYGWSIPLPTKLELPIVNRDTFNKKDRLIHESDTQARFYRYKNHKFSIRKASIIDAEQHLLKMTRFLLDYFKNKPSYKWLTVASAQFNDAINDEGKENAAIIIPDLNPYMYLTGFPDYFSKLHYLIFVRKAAKIIYETYNGKKLEWILSPYFLKEYNNRWFLFGYNHELNKLTNAAIDRIQGIEEIDERYVDKSEVEELRGLDNFELYFEDIIGVSLDKSKQKEEVVLKFASDIAFQRVMTKPIHPSQKSNLQDRRDLVVKIEVIPNHELYQTLLSFGDDVEVLAPRSVRDELSRILRSALGKYEKKDDFDDVK